MTKSQFPALSGRISAVALAACLALAGCGNEASITGTDTNAVTLTVTDPLDGSLNSTDGSTPPDPGKRIDRLAEILGLTAEQKAAFAAAYQTLHDGIRALHEQVKDGSLTRDEARAAADVLREEFEAALQVILTEEQWNQLQEMRENADGRGRGHREPGKRWAAWLREIGATQDQATAVFAALETFHDGLRGIHQQLKDREITPAEARTAAMALREAFRASLQEILTAEQYAALLELLPDCPGPRPHRHPPHRR